MCILLVFCRVVVCSLCFCMCCRLCFWSSSSVLVVCLVQSVVFVVRMMYVPVLLFNHETSPDLLSVPLRRFRHVVFSFHIMILVLGHVRMCCLMNLMLC